MADLPFVPEDKLIAFADGALAPEERAEVEAALARSPALANRVARLRQTRQIVETAFDGALAHPVPEQVQRAAAGAPPILHSAQLIWLAGAVVAALAAGLLVGRLSAPSARSPAAPRLAIAAAEGPMAGAELAAVLDETVGGVETPFANRLSTTVLLSFPARDNRLCRHFRVTGGREAVSGIACRLDEGWRIELLATMPAESADGPRRVAEAADPAEAAIDRLIEGAPLDSAGERLAVEKAWRR